MAFENFELYLTSQFSFYPLVEYSKLTYKNSACFALVFPEDVPLIKHRKIMSYHGEFKSAIADSFYPIETGIAQLIQYKWLIDLLGTEINPNIPWDNIEEQDLYRFFIANISQKEDQIIAERSDLEQLLGFKQLEISEDIAAEPTTPSEPPLSTNDVLLDVITVTLLNFKHGYNLINSQSLTQLMQMNEYASQLHSLAEKKAEEKYGEKKNSSTSPPKKARIARIKELTEAQQQIAQRAKLKGIPIPQL